MESANFITVCYSFLFQEVLTFQRFLQDTGGHTGGWNEEDHLLFLRFRNKHHSKHKEDVTFLSSLKQHLPGK
jgi:hypothetical protein